MFIGIDVGGTFTDIVVNLGNGSDLLLHKLPSTPDAPEWAIIDGLKRILADHDLAARDIARLAHGTTVGTNALIQRRCGKVGLVTSVGFRDLLELARQTRPTVYDMHKDHPEPLVPREYRIEVPQRRLANGSVHVPLDETAVVRAAGQLGKLEVDSVVVCFLHSYAYPEDEERAAAILREHLDPRVAVLTSSSVYPEFREYERFSTAVLNAALINVVGAYLDRLSQSASEMGVASEIKISQSSGGLMSVRMAREYPIRASLSGPAAGVQGAHRRASLAGLDNIITLDVGGTSADVALLLNGMPVEVNARDLAGFPMRIPCLDVNAVGAGGGSVAWIDKDGLLKVGPHSAGAVPGPVCYDLGGVEPTVTDANVMLGRLNGEALLDGRMPIRRELSVEAIKALADRLGVTPDAAALGIIEIACATMVKAIRSISVERGHTPSDFALFVYGGAGALHAIDVARDLGMKRVIIPPCPGLLCAEGAMNAALSIEFVATTLSPLTTEALDRFHSARAELEGQAAAWFAAEAVPESRRKLLWSVGARYFGQNYELTLSVDVNQSEDQLLQSIRTAFHDAHERNYGFSAASEPIQIVNLSVKALGELQQPALPLIPKFPLARPIGQRETMFDLDDWRTTPIFRRVDLVDGQTIRGPAIIDQMDTTVLIFPGDISEVDRWGNLDIQLKE